MNREDAEKIVRRLKEDVEDKMDLLLIPLSKSGELEKNFEAEDIVDCLKAMNQYIGAFQTYETLSQGDINLEQKFFYDTVKARIVKIEEPVKHILNSIYNLNKILSKKK